MGTSTSRSQQTRRRSFSNCANNQRQRCFASVERLAISLYSDGQRDCGEESDLPKLVAHLGEAVSLEQNPAHHAQEMRQWKNFADDLCPSWHSAKRKHKS